MQPIEIIVIIGAVVVLVGVVISEVIRKLKGKGGCGGDCSSCPYCCTGKRKKK